MYNNYLSRSHHCDTHIIDIHMIVTQLHQKAKVHHMLSKKMHRRSVA